MAKKEKNVVIKNPDYLIIMSESPLIGKNKKNDGSAGSLAADFTPPIFQLIVAAFFTAGIVMIVRMHSYTRPMGLFYWSLGSADEMTSLADFFSYFKMVAIVICGTLAFLILLYRMFSQTLAIRKSYAYIPMGIYLLFVLVSYIASVYKEFSLFGFNDRFEGTVTLFAYIIMLFYIINLVQSEKAVRWILYPLAATSAVLSFLGLSQALNMDFFRTYIGKRLITPPSYWPRADELEFAFNNREIYQTVYNINYVSFYLTLLIPIFAMLFIHERNIGKKAAWGALFVLLFFNMIGSQSSGGIMGFAVILLTALIVLNKRLWQWKKSVAVLLILMVIVSAGNFARFAPELFGAVNSVLGKQVLTIPGQEPVNHSPGGSASGDTDKPAEAERTHIDYIETATNGVTFSLNGEKLMVLLDNMENVSESTFQLYDKDEQLVATRLLADGTGYVFDDPRFSMCTLQSASGENGEQYLIMLIDAMQWAFQILPDGVTHINQLGKPVYLVDVPHAGFEDNPSFGSGRGYIWSRSLPMLKDALVLGYGADTYALIFPHKDYAGKYNSGTFSSNVNVVIDKPHNMYIGMIIGTGGISLLAFLALVFIYLGQSARLYFKPVFQDGFLPFAGAGIFFGICGFMVSAFVNDSTVSVMPMFYGLLGTGIGVNHMIKKRLRDV